MKRAVWISGVIALASLVAWFASSRRGNADDTYRFVGVERGEVVSTVSSTGTLEATTTVDIGTQVSGQIAEILVDFNDHVKKGQLLARIDPVLLEQEVRQTEASLERAQAELDNATRELERTTALFDAEAVTQRELDTARYQHSVASAARKSAEIALDKARRNLRYTEIRSPIDGIVLGRLVDVGQTVAASLSAPQLFLIAEDLSKLQILASVDESDIGKIFEGQEAQFTVQAHGDRKFNGSVKQIRLQSAVAENVVSYTVVIGVDNPDGSLLPGMTATVELVVSRASDVLRVSNAALRFRATDEMRAELRKRRGNDENGGDQDSARRERGNGNGGGGWDRGANSGGPNGAANGAASGAARGPASGGVTNGAGGRGWDRGGTSGEGQSTRGLLWVVDASGQLDVIPVKTGLTDGQYTEIEGDKLTEGIQVIAAVTSGATTTNAANPFQQQQQQPQGPRGGRPGGF